MPPQDTPAEPKRPAQFRLDVDAPADLRALLLQAPGPGTAAVRRRGRLADAQRDRPADRRRLGAGAVAAARRRAISIPVVKVQRVDDGAEPPLLRMSVQPGPRATIERLTLEVQGGLYDEVAGGDAQAEALQRALQTEWALQPGQPFTQSAWDSAKNRVLATLRSNGYLGAQWSGTAAQVNAENNTVRLFVVADSGELFRIGSIRTAGLQRFDEEAVIPTARELIGKPATEQLLRDVQDRLLSLGLFESIIIDVDANSARTRQGPGAAGVARAAAAAGHRRRRLCRRHRLAGDAGAHPPAHLRYALGHAQQAAGRPGAEPVDRRPDVAPAGRRLPQPAGRPGREADHQRRDRATPGTPRAGRTRDTLRIWRLIYAEYTRARLETSAGDNDSEALSGNYHWTWRDVDDLRTPTRGTVWSLQGGAGVAHGTVTPADTSQETEDSGPFARLYGRVQGYLPLGNNFYGSARLELGQVFVQETLSVPDTLLFRAGGDDSVRGYAYRSLGPEINGAVVSGSTLFTASLQVARPIFADQPAFLWALFVDAGNASDGWNKMRPVLGYGVGLHWRSPVGPLRVDLAYGEEMRKFRLHFSVGVVF